MLLNKVTRQSSLAISVHIKWFSHCPKEKRDDDFWLIHRSHTNDLHTANRCGTRLDSALPRGGAVKCKYSPKSAHWYSLWRDLNRKASTDFLICSPYLSIPVIGKLMSCDPHPPPGLPAYLPFCSAVQARPPFDIDFSVCLTPWVIMLSLFVHKSHMSTCTQTHTEHTHSTTTVTKLAKNLKTRTTFNSLHFTEDPVWCD